MIRLESGQNIWNKVKNSSKRGQRSQISFYLWRIGPVLNQKVPKYYDPDYRYFVGMEKPNYFSSLQARAKRWQQMLISVKIEYPDRIKFRKYCKRTIRSYGRLFKNFWVGACSAGCLLNKKKIDNTDNKKCNFFAKITKFLPKLIKKVLLFLYFRLAPTFN